MNECKGGKLVVKNSGGAIRRVSVYRHLRMVSMSRERLIRPDSDLGMIRRVSASGILRTVSVRRERFIRLLFHRLADLINDADHQ